MTGDWTLSTAADGNMTLQRGGRYIHSRYRPGEEAEKLVNRFDPGIENPKWLIVLGDGLGYLTRAFEKRFPDAGIITIFFHPRKVHPQKCFPDFPGVSERNRRPGTYYWFPDEPGTALYDWIINIIPEHHADSISLFTWKSALLASPDPGSSLLKDTSRALTFLGTNLRTIREFSYRWRRNALMTIRHQADTVPLLDLHTEDSVVVVAASGPELEAFIPSIRRYRKRCLLCALPSSIKALTEADLFPDLIVHSDPGFWARYHLSEKLTPSGEGQPILIHSLYGALPFHGNRELWNQRLQGRSIFLEEDSPFSPLSPGNFSLPVLPARGTVAASALDFLLIRGRGPIFFAGLDLANRDLQSHVKPHTFDTFYLASANRYESYEGLLFRLSLPGPGGSNLDLYRSYFSNALRNQRVLRFSIGNTNAVPGVTSRSLNDFCDLLGQAGQGHLTTRVLDHHEIGKTLTDNLYQRMDYLASMPAHTFETLLRKGSGLISAEERRLQQTALLAGEGKCLSHDDFICQCNKVFRSHDRG